MNGQRVLDLAASVGHASDFTAVIETAMFADLQAKASAEPIEARLATHKVLEDEARMLNATIKSTEARKDELVAQAHLKISRDAARLVDFRLKAGYVVFSRVADVGRSVVVRAGQTGWIVPCNLMRIAAERLKRSNLLAQKLGLMQDLLTGKVPVKVEEPEVEDG